MSKVKKITVSNLKAVSELTANFNGCTAIITGGNNKGKTSFLRSLPDRLRGNKPEIILKEGESNGFAEWQLTTGERLRWEFNNTTKAGEKLIYISDKEIKASLTAALASKFFPETFDVDEFLQSAPMKQRKTLQQLVGLDFTDIDKRYDEAYKERETLNRIARDAKIIFDQQEAPEKKEFVNIEALTFEKSAIRNKLNALYIENKNKNDQARIKYETELKEWQLQKNIWVSNQESKSALITKANNLMAELKLLGYKGNDVDEWINKLPVPEINYSIPEPVEPAYPEPKPDDSELQEIDAKILEATKINELANKYAQWLKDKETLSVKQQAANEADAKVQAIQKERDELIRTAKLPEWFSFSNEGILYNNLPFTKEQLSSSGIYIAALKLASMKIGEVRTLHFDASFLDKNSLHEIEAWAQSQDLQLLIERPDFDGGEIEYQLIENL